MLLIQKNSTFKFQEEKARSSDMSKEKSSLGLIFAPLVSRAGDAVGLAG